MKTAQQWIQHLELQQHPEGGWYKETYRSDLKLPAESIAMQGPRAAATVIYFLLQGHEKSHFHRIQSDEHWFFHGGSTLNIHILNNNASKENYRCLPLGPTHLQQWVPAKQWFAAELQAPTPEAFALMSCVVAPGFDFADFALARADALQQQYPEHRELVKRLCLN